MRWCGNALKTVKCLTKYLIISYNNHSNANMNEADFLILQSQQRICPLKLGICSLPDHHGESLCFILGRKRDLRILRRYQSQSLTWPRNFFNVTSRGSVVGVEGRTEGIFQDNDIAVPTESFLLFNFH